MDHRPEAFGQPTGADRARMIVLSLAAAKKLVSRRALRSAGVKGWTAPITAVLGGCCLVITIGIGCRGR
jgi:hypothetical protein